jgi:hypothetical protein
MKEGDTRDFTKNARPARIEPEEEMTIYDGNPEQRKATTKHD